MSKEQNTYAFEDLMVEVKRRVDSVIKMPAGGQNKSMLTSKNNKLGFGKPIGTGAITDIISINDADADPVGDNQLGIVMGTQIRSPSSDRANAGWAWFLACRDSWIISPEVMFNIGDWFVTENSNKVLVGFKPSEDSFKPAQIRELGYNSGSNTLAVNPGAMTDSSFYIAYQRNQTEIRRSRFDGPGTTGTNRQLKFDAPVFSTSIVKTAWTRNHDGFGIWGSEPFGDSQTPALIVHDFPAAKSYLITKLSSFGVLESVHNLKKVVSVVVNKDGERRLYWQHKATLLSKGKAKAAMDVWDDPWSVSADGANDPGDGNAGAEQQPVTWDDLPADDFSDWNKGPVISATGFSSGLICHDSGTVFHVNTSNNTLYYFNDKADFVNGTPTVKSLKVLSTATQVWAGEKPMVMFRQGSTVEFRWFNPNSGSEPVDVWPSGPTVWTNVTAVQQLVDGFAIWDSTTGGESNLVIATSNASSWPFLTNHGNVGLPATVTVGEINRNVLPTPSGEYGNYGYNDCVSAFVKSSATTITLKSYTANKATGSNINVWNFSDTAKRDAFFDQIRNAPDWVLVNMATKLYLFTYWQKEDGSYDPNPASCGVP
jgi:hypothetical protein